MPGQTLSDYDAVLKEDYGPKIQSTINTRRILMARLQRTGDQSDFAGRRAVVPLNIRPSQSVGARPDGGQTPSPQKQTFVDLLIPMVYNYGTAKFTLPTIKASASDAGAFERVMDAEMNGLRRDLQNDENRQLWGDGFGSLGQTSGTGSSSTSLTMSATNHKVKINMIIDIYTATSGGTKEVDSVQVSAVSGATVTLETAATWSSGSYVFREDARGEEMMGIKGIVDSATYATTLHGISRSTYPEFAGQILANGAVNRPVTLDLLQQGFLQVEEQAEGEISLGVTSFNLWRKIGNLMVPDRRYTPAMTLAGGFTALDFNGKPIVADRDAVPNTFFWLDESTFTIYELSAHEWDDTDGNILHKAPGEAAYEALMTYYAEVACHDPANNCVIRDLSET